MAKKVLLELTDEEHQKMKVEANKSHRSLRNEITHRALSSLIA
jgi:hypothetical protein